MDRSTGSTVAASVWYLVISLLVLGLKFWAYFQTGSQAFFSDAAESIVNVLAAIFSIIFLRLGEEPADRNHPYGHGKFEDVSAVIEGLLIFGTGGVLAFVGVRALLGQPEVHDLDFGLLITLIATVINFSLARYLVASGRRARSSALIASGKHVFSDVWTTLGIVLGVVIIRISGFVWIDGALAIVVAFLLFRTSFGILRSSVGDLMDEMNPDLVNDLIGLFNVHRFEGAIDLHHFRIMKNGRFHHIDAHLVVPEFWTVRATREIVSNFERQIQKDYSFGLELAIHLDPCRQSYCRICDYPECPIRRNAFEAKPRFLRERVLSVPPEDEVL